MGLYRSFQEIRKDLCSGATTCERVVSQYLDRIAAAAHLNVFVDVYAEEALDSARRIDEKIAQDRAGRLAGMVIGLKDLICYADHPLEASSRILKGYTSPFSATAVERLVREDAIVVGRINCDEFGMGSSNEHSAHGPVLNNIDNRYVPGGSSGGSAVAVEAGLCTASLGTDTGGSVRQPAAFCGVIGCKPTYARISRHGLVAYASSFDSIGLITSDLQDNALLLEVVAGHDPNDATSSDKEVEPYTGCTWQNGQVRIGWIEESISSPAVAEDVRDNFQDTVADLKSAGHRMKKISFPLLKYVLPTYYILTTAEASSNLSRFDGIRYGYRSPKTGSAASTVKETRTSGFGAEVQRRILLGTYVLTSDYQEKYYARATNVRKAIVQYTTGLFRDIDFMISPTAPTTAFLLGQHLHDPLKMYASDQFTVHASVTGNPAISIPNGTGDNGMPLGLQVMAGHFSEGTLYAFSEWYLNQKKSSPCTG